MSYHKLLIFTLFLCGCLTAGLLAVKGGAGRHPASIPAANQLVKYPNERINVAKILQLQKQQLKQGFTKLKKPLEINISLIDKDIEVGETFTLRADVTSLDTMPGSEFKWVIDPSLEIVSGSISGTLNELQPDETKTLEVVLKATERKPAAVFLNVYTEDGGQKIGGNGHFNTAKYMDLPQALGARKTPTVKIPVKRVIY